MRTVYFWVDFSGNREHKRRRRLKKKGVHIDQLCCVYVDGVREIYITTDDDDDDDDGLSFFQVFPLKRERGDGRR